MQTQKINRHRLKKKKDSKKLKNFRLTNMLKARLKGMLRK